MYNFHQNRMYSECITCSQLFTKATTIFSFSFLPVGPNILWAAEKERKVLLLSRGVNLSTVLWWILSAFALLNSCVQPSLVLCWGYYHVIMSWFHFKDRLKLSAHIFRAFWYLLFYTRIKATCLSHTNKLTCSILPLWAFPPLCLSDGVELTGAESLTMAGSKDKLLNTHALVTYVLACLNRLNFSKSAFVSCFPCFHSAHIFSPCLSEQNEFLHTANCYLVLCDWISFCQMHKITFQQQHRSEPRWFARCLYIKQGRGLL